MKSDVNGCSTCKPGEESIEWFTPHWCPKNSRMCQYDYRHTNGELFSCVKPTLQLCREARNKWLLTIDPDAVAVLTQKENSNDK